MDTSKLSEVYPGDDNRFVICDICGCKFRVYQTVKIEDKYNLSNNLIVCFQDADKVNEGLYPITIKETLLKRPDYVRPEGADVYIENENDDRLPGAPRNLRAIPHPLNDSILLTWDGPIDCGSGSIVGYRITRAHPQLSYQFVLISNTDSFNTQYEDTVSNMSELSTYQVAAITDLGIGPYSDYAFYPSVGTDIAWLDIEYLALSDDLSILETSDTGYYIRLNHTEGGVV